MPVPLFELNLQNKANHNALLAAFERVVEHGQFILGPEVAAFEGDLIRRVGVGNAIGVSSGTDALLLSLMALDVGPGDEVLCPSFTFFATAGCISRLGAEPVFVDVLADSFNLDVADAATKVSGRTKVIMPVHLYGQAADMDGVLELARTHKLKVVEDCAQALGAKWKGQEVGSMGDFGAFSFFPTKNLGGFGDGGVLLTNDDDLAEKARVLRVHGSKPKYFHKTVGGNFRLDALQAALLGVKLGNLEQLLGQRRGNATQYLERLEAESRLKDNVILPSEGPDCWHTWNQFTIRVPGGRRDDLREFLQEKGIASEIYYPLSLHQQECFKNLTKRSCPVSEQLSGECLSLPIYPELTLDMLDEVVSAIVGFF
tara:strand:+ start:245 stop:1357 length:1113 start_codon:yes stop_codon:yes gene_type:complete